MRESKANQFSIGAPFFHVHWSLFICSFYWSVANSECILSCSLIKFNLS